MQTVGVDHTHWKNRRVLVTGHTGFIGGWLCAWLGDMGAKVTGYALAPPTQPSFYDAVGMDGSMRSVIADIRDLEPLHATFADFLPQTVIHLAAQPLVRAAFAAPVETFATNVMGTVNLLDAIRAIPSVEAVVVVTTDKVYDNRESDWGYREEDRLGGREPYGCSKACAEHVVDAFRRSYFESGAASLGVATVRAGNVIGGGDWAVDRLVPDAVRSFTAGQPLSIRNPESVRPWQHVLDPVLGILMLAERLSASPCTWSGAWNLGPPENEAHSVREIADELVRLWGDGACWSNPRAEAAAPYESRLLAINPTRAETKLGWRRRWSLVRALASTVDWYKGYVAGNDMRALTTRQIAAFEGAN